MSKPSIPQGTRDFGPDIVRKRNFILDTIRNVFERYGFQPLETPAMENLETLMGKYGEEGDKLIFRILNNGLDLPAKAEQARNDFEKVLEGKNVKGITERALRYDLTIPFARWVAMNHQLISLPFRRYQIQPVWRADRPQKGRYREFVQCDADIVGSRSLTNETELALIFHHAFTKLGLANYSLRINHRKILSALATISGGENKITDITMAIDKLDKIGMEKVKAELSSRGLSEDSINIISQYLELKGSNEEKLNALASMMPANEDAHSAIAELQTLLNNLRAFQCVPVIDLTLARGLNYYTGMIYEAAAPEGVKIGSIGGGGRYDDLTGLFGVPGIPGIGISFGVDRIYDVLEELQLFPAEASSGTRVLFFNLGEKESQRAFTLLQSLRNNGISGEMYHEMAKFDKQFRYAEKKKIGYIVIIGEKELSENTCTIKNLSTGQQKTIPSADLVNYTF